MDRRAVTARLNRLHVRQAVRVMAVALVLGLVFSAVQVAVDLHNERQNVRASILQVLESLRRPASQAAFSISHNLAEGVAESLLMYQPIYSAAITTETGLSLANRRRAPAHGSMAWLADWLMQGEREFSLALYADNLKAPVGKVTVQVDATVLASTVLARAGLTLLLELLKNMGLALAATVVFYYTLSRPLSRLSHALAEAQSLRTATSLHVQLGRQADQAMETLLAAANRFLESQVETRTEALRQQNTELQRLNIEVQAARREAESAAQAKSQFLANMSHELRTPLNAILGYAQILERDATLDERQRRGVTTIERSGAHLLALINDVLDLSKIEASKFTLAPQAVDLASFVEDIGYIIRVKADEKQLQFTCATEPGLPPTVLCDEKQMRQVLLNLLGNAVKFTHAGEVSLYLESAAGAPEGMAGLRFIVQDTGVGMQAEALERIFQPFEQAGDVARRAGGTGLGLAISAQIVGLMGSHIDVESRPGTGSRFAFTLHLPLVSVSAQPAEAGPALTGYEGERRSILLIDDLDANRIMLADLLEGLGFITRQASSGPAGLDSAYRQPPDLVITDIAMPEMDGLEVIRRLRQHFGGPAGAGALPVFAVSASVSLADENASLAAGANLFLAKPLNQPLLLERIGAYLQLQWIMAAPAPSAPTDAPMLAPPPQDIERLHALAMAGNMRNIRRFATELGERDARYRPFAERLQALADGYQSRAILALAQHHLDA